MAMTCRLASIWILVSTSLAAACNGGSPSATPASSQPTPAPAQAPAPPPAPHPPPAPVLPEPGLTVQAPGQAPLLVHAYAGTRPMGMGLAFDTETATKRGNLVSSTMQVAAALHPTWAAGSGTVRVAVASVTAVDRPRQQVDAAGINYYLKAWVAPTFVLGVTAQGDLSPDSSDWKFPEMLFNQDQALHEVMARLWPVFPTTAIGPGATWTQVKRDIVNGVALTRTTRFTLTSATTVEATFEEAAAPQAATVSSGTLQVLSYRATGTATYALAANSALIGLARGEMTTHLEFENRQAPDTITRKTTWTLAPQSPLSARKSRGATAGTKP